jgi:hypothetical protein
MGNGLLAQWQRRVVARGLVGAVFLAIPVAVAAAIGFGGSLSGVAGGLSAIAEGPSTTTTATQLAPYKLNRAVKALAAHDTTTTAALGSSAEAPVGSGVGAGGGSTTGVGGSGGGAGGGSGSSDAPAVSNPSAPDIPLPGGGSSNDTANQVNNGVSNLINGVQDTVNGLLGGK